MHTGQLFPAVCFWKNLIPDAVKYWFSLTSVKAFSRSAPPRPLFPVYNVTRTPLTAVLYYMNAPGGGVLPYMGYIGMCRCEGYGFQAVYSRIGQRERQKSNRLRQAKQQLCTCITLFCTFLCRRCTTTTWNCLISRFVEDGNKRQQLSFSFPELWCSPLEFNSKNICQHLTN